MGSGNSTDSVSFASNMAYRLKAGLRRIARAVVEFTERLAHKPLSYETKKRLMLSATSRKTFVWDIKRGSQRITAEPELSGLYVRVTEEAAPAVEEIVVESFPEEPIVERVYNTPSFSTVTPTSSGAMMFEFSGSNFEFDKLDMEEDFDTEVYEAPVFSEYVETEEEKQYYESLYEDLTVDAVLEYMDTIELYAKPVEHVESEEERQYFESLYEDFEVDAVLDYMDTIELYAKPAEYVESEEERQYFESLYEDLEVEAVLGYMDTIELYAKPVEHVESEEERQYFESLYEDLEVEAVLDYMDTIELYAPVKEDSAQEIMALDAPEMPALISAPAVAGFIAAPVSAGYIEAPAEAEVPAEHVETEEERRFYESVYEDLTVFAVLDYMDTIELYAKPAPEYVITDIASNEVCETTVEMEQPRYVPDYVISEIAMPEECETAVGMEQPKPAKQTILSQFIFGFDAPAKAVQGPTKFRFIAGTEEEDDEDVENVQVYSYSGDAAVSANPVSGGPLAL